MIVESIRTVLGQELADQVEQALQGKGKDGKDLDLVVGNDGTYVPADKYDQAKGQAASAEQALKAASTALKGVGGSGDPQKIADDVQKAQETINSLATRHKEEMDALRTRTALKIGLANRVYDIDDVLPLLDQTKIKINDKGDLETDPDELLQPVKDKKAYLLREQEQKPEIHGAKPAEPGVPPKPEGAPAGPAII